jgi:SAM-dependent methyltransferase
MRSRLARRRRSANPGVPPEPPTPPAIAQRGIAARPVDGDGATGALYDRLTDAEVARILDGLEPGHRAMWDAAPEQERRRLTLSFGLLEGVPGVAERTGLSPATPPREIHSMVHGWVTEIGGSYYLADLVDEMMKEIGHAPAPGARVLDFSCSSGRVVRPLAAARPEVSWNGCDPNADAIGWMRDNVPAVEVLVSPTTPPLPLHDGTFDLVFAISVWSHYSAAAALSWLEELRRLVRPGGHILLTTHGLQACIWFSNNPDHAIGQRLGPDWIADTTKRLQHDGHCFWDVFGEDGDWGVVDREWGLAFFTPEWLLANITPKLGVRTYRIGGAHGNQDVYVLERK